MSGKVNVSSFDSFVDDILDSDENLLKGELDLLIMQHLFNSLDLKNVDNTIDENESFYAA